MIPLDILGLVFTEYGKQETLDSPLETLLLVCKEWKNLCLSLKILWSSFNIVFGTGIEAKKWASLVPKRLARSGSSTPIHAVIMNNRKQAHQYRDLSTGGIEHDRCPALVGRPIFDPYMPCSCHYDIPGHIVNILEALAGSEGQMCHRWVTLCLSLHTRGQRRDYFSPLTYPTPNLRTLILQGVDSSWIGTDAPTLFPSTPSLLDLSLQHTALPHIHTGPQGLFQTLKRLELQDYNVPDLFPATLPSLASLVIRGHLLHGANSQISVPKLTCLTREMTSLTLHRPYDCFVIPFKNLITLGIFYHGRLPLPDMGSAFTAALIKLLFQANNVKTIAGDEFSIMTLFLILSTSPSPFPRGLGLTTDRLKVCVMDRRHAGRIEWALESGDALFMIDMGENMMRDMDSVKRRKGWATSEVVEPTRPQQNWWYDPTTYPSRKGSYFADRLLYNP